jgi:hypothetical protein
VGDRLEATVDVERHRPVGEHGEVEGTDQSGVSNVAVADGADRAARDCDRESSSPQSETSGPPPLETT